MTDRPPSRPSNPPPKLGRPLRIVVVGAGIGGLAAAIGLSRLGDVTVVERTERLAPVGAGLSLFGNGLAALSALGLDAPLRTITAAPAAPLRAGQRTPSGRWLATLPATAVAQLQVVHRRDLQQLLLDAVPPGTVRLGTTVTTVTAGGTVHVQSTRHQSDRSHLHADLVVAADGLHSQIRRSFPDAPATRYVGWTAWRGITDKPVDLHAEAGETWGRGQRFGMAPLPDSRIYWFAVRTMPSDQQPPGRITDHAWLEALFSDWHQPIPRLLAATAPTSIIRTPILDLDRPARSFVNDRTVLLGDAAHAMTPDLGQGANQALEDAATLTALLNALPQVDRETLPAALHTYDRLRRPRTQRLAALSQRLGRVAQTRSVAGAAVRDIALRLAPPALLGRQALAVQTWHPPQPAPRY